MQSVVKVQDLVAEIAAANEEQARGVTQISSAMRQVNQGAQSASQQSEELAGTASELGQLADRLRVETARFKLREGRALDGAIAGMTPEMLRQVAELVKAQIASYDGGDLPEAKDRDGGIELALDRDERGYGEF